MYLSTYKRILLKYNLIFIVRPYYEIYLPSNELLDIIKHLIEIGEGLLVLHNNGIIHSNLIPSNILYDEEYDKIMICDYGLNVLRDNKLEKKSIKYISVEELKNKEVTKGVDIWNFGLLIYKYFTGEDLFKNGNVEEILKCKYVVTEDTPYLLKELLKQVFKKEIVKRMEIIKIIEILKSIILIIYLF